ncbi:aspartate dehydrogenase domain-containing protein [Paenarthrobacter sp. JL.01a]|uniref:aspartate dehydrogenase domain-containing protein n=1 Tax=Paenarthrobacter sp. JL.01a TaxID=2979324 RepID=UPI0021C7D5AD|nr:aspartate dehydrogenase domain-containing protein [Paenarthrobacter sp. JL.01a]UXM91592.1 DUF108 domain-containing protein [Paenarthrobacter sp. JL.01a]
MARIGVIGSGGIATSIASYVLQAKSHNLAFVQGRTVGAGITTTTMATGKELRGTDLVVEAAHPEVIRKHGARILTTSDLMVLSCGALVDDDVRVTLAETAKKHGTRLILPHGALVGVDSHVSQLWETAAIEFVKSPSSLEPAPDHTDRRTVLYDGPVRGIAALYPRNVNAMVTYALATVGLDNCRARLVSDPDATLGRLETVATGADGSRLHIIKEQPMNGVSGTEMAGSVLGSLQKAMEQQPGLVFG